MAKGSTTLPLKWTTFTRPWRNSRRGGCELIDETPREGAHGMTIAFMHPKASHSILMELVQPTADISKKMSDSR